MVTGLEQPSDNDVHVHACGWTMWDYNDFNDYHQSPDCSHFRCGECDLSRGSIIIIAYIISKWNHRNMVTGLEQPSDNDVYVYSYCRTMCYDNDLNDYHQSHDCSHFRCGESDLSRRSIIRIAYFVFEWNHWNVVTGLE